MTRWTRTCVAPLLGALALAVGAPADASGQSLHLAELFAEQGRMSDARAEVLAWFEIRGGEATPEELQHGLFLRGRLSDDPASGMRDLERLVAEYPEGRFTARALTWMGAFRADRGEMQTAAALYTRVVREYPESESAAAARQWLSSQGIVVEAPEAPEAAARPPAAAAPVPVDSGPPVPADTAPAVRPVPADTLPADTAVAPPIAADTAVAPPIAADTVRVPAAGVDSVPPTAPSADTAAVLVPYSEPPPGRPAADSTAAPDSTPPVAEVSEPPQAQAPAAPAPPVERIPHGPPVPGAATGGSWAVQIGAFRNAEGARGLAAELVSAGFDARLIQIPLNDLLRVRIGRFEGQDGATAVLERVRAAGYDGTVVNDARQETVVR